MSTEAEVKREAELLELARARAEVLEAEAAAIRQNNILTRDGKGLLQANLDLQQQNLEIARMEVGAIAAAKRAIAADASKEAEILYNLKAKGLDLEDDTIRAAAKALKLASSNVDKQKAANTSAEKILRSTLGISDAWKSTTLGALATGVATGQLHTAILNSVNVADILLSTFTKILEVSVTTAKAYDEMSASIRRVVSVGSGLEEQTYNQHRAMLQYGVGIAEAGAATNALIDGMSAFTFMSGENQLVMQNQTVLLKEMGVELQTSAGMFNVLNKGLGMSAPQIETYTKRLVAMSQQLRVPPEVIFKDWQTAASELMKYGDQMDEVLYGLAKQAKNTGLAMGDLLGIAKRFDQFDSAGEAVGRLNAILGGPYLNAINMVYMTEDERIQALRDTIALSGNVWAAMNRHEQQAVATAAGITDMSVAARLFGGTQEEFGAASASQADLAERAKQAQSAMDQLRSAMEGLAIAVKPAVEIFGWFTEGLAKFASHKVGAAFMSIAAGFTLIAGMAIAGYLAYVKFNKEKLLMTTLTRMNTPATVADTVAEGANAGAKGANLLTTEGLSKSELRLRLDRQLGIAPQAASTAGEGSLTAAKAAGIPVTNGLTAATTGLGSAMAMVAATLGVMVVLGGIGYWAASLGTKGKWIAISLGLIALAVSIAMVTSAITAGGASATTLKGWALLGAGGAAAALGAVAYHDGGVVAGQKGRPVTAQLMPGETVLDTHKKSGAQAAADQGIAAPAPDFTGVTNAINNLVAKLNTLIDARKTGQKKAVDVTLEMDYDRMGQATAQWIDDVYGL